MEVRGTVHRGKVVDRPFGLQLDTVRRVVPEHGSECATPCTGDPRKEQGASVSPTNQHHLHSLMRMEIGNAVIKDGIWTTNTLFYRSLPKVDLHAAF